MGMVTGFIGELDLQREVSLHVYSLEPPMHATYMLPEAAHTSHVSVQFSYIPTEWHPVERKLPRHKEQAGETE